MCAPAIEYLSGRLLQLHDSIRSTRLSLLESPDQRPAHRVSVSGAVELKRAEGAVEPNELAIHTIIDGAIHAFYELNGAQSKLRTWNGKTPSATKELFRDAFTQLLLLRVQVAAEIQKLLACARTRGLTIDATLIRTLTGALADLDICGSATGNDNDFLRAMQNADAYIDELLHSPDVEQAVEAELRGLMSRV